MVERIGRFASRGEFELSDTVRCVRPRPPRSLEIAALTGVGALSRLARARRRHDAAGQARLEARSGPDRRARGAAAGGLGARVGDQRQDDDDRDGRRDPAARGCGSPTTARARTSSRASPPPCSPPATPSSGCSRSTRRRCPRWRAASTRRRSCSSNLFRDQLDRYGELELLAARWREATASLPDAQLVLNADDPHVGELGHRPRAACGCSASTTRGSRGRRSSTPPTRSTACAAARRTTTAAAYVGHLGDYRCPACGHARPALDVAAREIELRGLDGAAFTLDGRRRDDPRRARAARASTTSTTRSPPGLSA